MADQCTKPPPWTYDDVEPFFSPSSCAQLAESLVGLPVLAGTIVPENSRAETVHVIRSCSGRWTGTPDCAAAKRPHGVHLSPAKTHPFAFRNCFAPPITVGAANRHPMTASRGLGSHGPSMPTVSCGRCESRPRGDRPAGVISLLRGFSPWLRFCSSPGRFTISTCRSWPLIKSLRAKGGPGSSKQTSLTSPSRDATT